MKKILCILFIVALLFNCDDGYVEFKQIYYRNHIISLYNNKTSINSYYITISNYIDKIVIYRSYTFNEFEEINIRIKKCKFLIDCLEDNILTIEDLEKEDNIE